MAENIDLSPYREGDSPIFAAKRCCLGDKAFPAAKIGTVPPFRACRRCLVCEVQLDA